MEAVIARRKAWDEARKARQRARERFLACGPCDPEGEREKEDEDEDATLFSVGGHDGGDGGFGSGAEDTSAPASVPELEADGDDDHDDDDDKPDSNVAEPVLASVVDDEEISWRMVVQPGEEKDEINESEGLWMKSSRSFL